MQIFMPAYIMYMRVHPVLKKFLAFFSKVHPSVG